jgi:IS30 family transposase
MSISTAWFCGICQKEQISVRITDEQIAQIEALINNRTRKCLGFRTPIEVASSVVALQG